MICSHCAFPIHPGEGVRYFGDSVAHRESRCLELLKTRIAELEYRPPFALCVAIDQISALISQVRAHKLNNPIDQVGINAGSPGSILNGYREGDLSFEEAVVLLRPLIAHRFSGLSFRQFQLLNADRCKWAFKHHGRDSDWTIFDCALAIAGEAGELCNLLKKVRRGDFQLESVAADVKAELADIITYVDAAFNELKADTATELMRKFDEVSARPAVNYDRHSPLCFGCHEVPVVGHGELCEKCNPVHDIGDYMDAERFCNGGKLFNEVPL